MEIATAYGGTLLTILVLDALWLMVLAKKFYAARMGHIFMEKINLTPVLFFYPLYALAVTLLCVIPALETGIAGDALWRGALLGMAAYAAYDLTNHATIPQWPLSVTIVDIAWGACVTVLASISGFYTVLFFS